MVGGKIQRCTRKQTDPTQAIPDATWSRLQSLLYSSGAYGGICATGRKDSSIATQLFIIQPHPHYCDGPMSGVEAAGFVLAAFPLLISALEHYRESAEVLKDWWRYKREYRKVKVEKNLSFREPLKSRSIAQEERQLPENS